ncbi:MAG: hypothetical protein K5669_11590, partial [Lachnospiraceae bacterium]|nr:hypothetical protein [Lachnospiraceae bacterium]
MLLFSVVINKNGFLRCFATPEIRQKVCAYRAFSSKMAFMLLFSVVINKNGFLRCFATLEIRQKVCAYR